MLQSMREGAKSPIMKAFLIFLAGGFAIWGIGDVTSGAFGGDKAVKAGDHSVSTQQAAIEFDRARRNLGAGASIGEALQTPLLDEVMGSLARKVLFTAEAERLGLTVTRQMQTDAIRQERAFQDEFGEFAEGRFLQTLGQMGMSEQDYLMRLTETLERDQILRSVAATAFYPTHASRALAAYQLEERTISYRGFPVTPDDIATPSEGALASWYNINSASYDAPLLRRFDAIILDPAMLEAEITIEDDAIEAAFDLRRDEFITPERRSLQQMVFETNDEAKAAFDEVASGADFATVASELLNWTQDDISLGTLSADALDAALAEAAFGAAKGDVVGPVESVFGYHVLQVNDVIAGSEATLADVKDRLIATLKAEQAIDLVYERANELEDILGGGASLQEAASAINVAVTAIEPIDANGFTIDGTEPASAIASDSNFLSIGWELDVDEISVLAETGEATFFVSQPVAETEPAPRALADVKERAITDFKREKAVLAAVEAATNAMKDSNALADVDSVTVKRSAIGFDHPAAGLITSQAFDIAQGDLAIIETGDEAVLIKTDAILPATADEVNQLAEQLSVSLARTVQTDWTAALALTLSEDFDLTMNDEAVRLLLVGAAR